MGLSRKRRRERGGDSGIWGTETTMIARDSEEPTRLADFLRLRIARNSGDLKWVDARAVFRNNIAKKVDARGGEAALPESEPESSRAKAFERLLKALRMVVERSAKIMISSRCNKQQHQQARSSARFIKR